MAAWNVVAYQGAQPAIEAARTALAKALEGGALTPHQVDLIRPPLGEPPLPAVIGEGAMFGFALAEGVKFDTPPGCAAVNPTFAALLLGVGGMQESRA